MASLVRFEKGSGNRACGSVLRCYPRGLPVKITRCRVGTYCVAARVRFDDKFYPLIHLQARNRVRHVAATVSIDRIGMRVNCVGVPHHRTLRSAEVVVTDE
jgi:hypothetical protein